MPATGQEPGCTRARVHHPVVAFQECIQKRIEEGQYKAKYKMIVEEEEIIPDSIRIDIRLPKH